MTRTLSKNVRIVIVSAGTFTFWKMDFKHVPYDQNIVKKREDRHRIRRDIYILKNLISSMFFMTRTLSKSGVWCKPWKPCTNSKTARQRRCIQNQNDCFTILITAPYGIQAFHKEDTYLLTYLICINMYVSMKSISRIFSKINNQNNFFYFFRENKFHEFFHHC